ncbi:NAD-dependent epimerase/dehydratase family protein [bacterium]|nr:NAD-dependent epimerase/dehydratase family protein [bacterium]
MLKRLLDAYSEKFVSRWVILAMDFAVVCVGFGVASLLVNNFELTPQLILDIQMQAIVAGVAYLIGFIIAGSYSGIIRHTSITDAYRILYASFIAVLILLLLSALVYLTGRPDLSLYIKRSIIIVHFLIVLFLLLGTRFVVRGVYQRLTNNQVNGRKPVLIYGAGSSGLVTKQTLENEVDKKYQVIGFIDDNTYKQGKTLEGVPVYAPDKVFQRDFIEKHAVSQIILSIQKLTPARKTEIIEKSLEFNLRTKVVPPIEKWIHGELSTRQIKAVNIEDLLQRDPIRLDKAHVAESLRGKIILVTGSAGSIGSEIARQVLHYQPKKVILLDQAESPLYEIEMDLKSNHPELFPLAEFVIGSVSDPMRMRKLFRVLQPEIVFHAAAYKHVPLMEDNPYEAIKVNILGTRTVADLSIEHRVEKFVMVSTDKAVNPTNVMGASKRIAELYTQSRHLKPRCKTQFITTRFGNVLGSNGSVIPLFKKQIEKGGPITITHKDITRYFMTIPEACNLVLEAGAMGKGGEIFVFDMGQSVRIHDLAKKMVKLSGLEEGKDIEIVFTGLRPGEKLYEELLASSENTKQTHHPKILIANTHPEDPEHIEFSINQLANTLASTEDNFALVAVMKTLVPEFVSNNSVFATLDLKKTVVNE